MAECIHQKWHREAVMVIQELSSNKRIPLSKAAFLISEYMLSVVIKNEGRMEHRIRFTVKGAVKKFNHMPDELTERTEVDLGDLCSMGILTEEGAEAIHSKNYDVFVHGDCLSKIDLLP